MSDGRNTLVRFASPELADQIENWRRTQPQIPTLAQTLRVLVAQGLAAEQKREPNNERSA